MRYLSRARLFFDIGLINIVRVAFYRAALKFPFSKVRAVSAETPIGEFYRSDGSRQREGHAPNIDSLKMSLFGTMNLDCSKAVPDWCASHLTGIKFPKPEREWWRISDFDSGIGDIKLIWEVSRFNWVLSFAQTYFLNGQTNIDRLNFWLKDWISRNPPYKGPNWKCGQEASIRVMHLAMAALLLKQSESSSRALLELINVHLKRIAPTISYAIAQDNNHGTSEAAALFIGGSWLASQNISEGKRWENLGRKWLENRAARLISVDGSFSQYSLNYHRVVVDTFAIVEIWRRHHQLPKFSTVWYERASAAVHWLHGMVSPENGDGPNLGANDGAHLLKLTDTDYRDFRPSIQLAMALFDDSRAYEADGPWNEPLYWFDMCAPDKVAPHPVSRQFDDGGFAVLRRGSAMAMLRYPRFRFRPSQADALHLDFWLGGRNLLRDAGSYSYNTESQWLKYFPGTESHNTVQFDGREQMPRVSRFLFSDWLKTSYIKPLEDEGPCVSFAAGYRDYERAEHRRAVRLCDQFLLVKDDIQGFKFNAVLRWRLEPGCWTMNGNQVSNGKHVIRVVGSVPIIRFTLIEGWESRYYMVKHSVPVLEVEINQPGSLTTEYRWL